jgi:hypothetical protein
VVFSQGEKFGYIFRIADKECYSVTAMPTVYPLDSDVVFAANREQIVTFDRGTGVLHSTLVDAAFLLREKEVEDEMLRRVHGSFGIW